MLRRIGGMLREVDKNRGKIDTALDRAVEKILRRIGDTVRNFFGERRVMCDFHWERDAYRSMLPIRPSRYHKDPIAITLVCLGMRGTHDTPEFLRNEWHEGVEEDNGCLEDLIEDKSRGRRI